MKKVAFYTLGCKVNQYETEAMGELFEKAGYQVVDDEASADVYVINTCTVTSLGDRKSRQLIRRAKKDNPDAVIAVVGCYSQTAPEEVSSIEGVNIILGTNDRNRIVEYVEKFRKANERIYAVEDIMQIREFEEMTIGEIKGKTRAFLKIQEGCNQYCTYCIIPYARGPIRSRKPEDIIKEVQRLADNGFKEVVLTGIHVASYGKDLDKGSLLDVLKAIHPIAGVERIRLSSIEPTLISEAFVAEIVQLHKMCPHFHLSLQSGCDETLKRMNRKYTTTEYKEKVDILRKYLPDVSLTTDIMVGFPGETGEEFEKTYDFVQEISFSQIHVFKYSPRKGTPAAKYERQVSAEIKQQRSERLMRLASEDIIKYNEKFLNTRRDVLFEVASQEYKEYYEGLTDNYIRVLCKFNESPESKIKSVLLTDIQGDALMGTPAEEKNDL
ncbi:tRNA (N(6)-L-threonylcarbamoyladenosine(37)-C(2))-methylthiotransferase MtaB [Geosporobacter ferrireducens]|uniref:Threonylcarbamoyladenosine tRNA methylthiotransferase MtaB n=1 Tax=Geosporobacter ferrireducens TaxID=1424294 RepID=A0A1D8GC91_9FIRM|nr:tRNA (N(6)-L-threonylcarbamoyladenosine(37)-C(2))-methylthiotransferase MtaB [Geosporobacter ferrireducens]AOT68529.1 tRNA (N(6)-L-threonylcarbamoyladenosine(37)-C(2))-methylthiotransferase MtaB [Geosporobacter ferrireducens]MTI53994.1 tRNA (N(6)-L-threonylcarbamoyladenosine(37)-C(2))-methylthiotransferase MtaB [Geosporobacter ferrireducens]